MLRRLFFCVALVPAIALAADAELYKKLDELYAKRDDAAAVKDTEAELSAALKANPDDYGVLWRAARWKFWVSDAASDSRLKKQLGKEGWDLGDRAVKANPAGAEGYYFGAICMGNYSTAVGILKALGEGIESKFNERLDKAISINDDIDLAGPLLAKGRYHYELPWPKRDLGKSRELYEKTIKKHPENLRAWFYLAETELKDGEKKKAKEAIDKALAGSISYDPPEAKRVKALAKPIADKIAEELK